MANMSYCRFQNTVRDFQDCLNHVGDGDLSSDEDQARKRLLELAAQMLECWGYTEDDGILTVEELSPAVQRERFAGDFEGWEEDDDGQ